MRFPVQGKINWSNYTYILNVDDVLTLTYDSVKIDPCAYPDTLTTFNALQYDSSEVIIDPISDAFTVTVTPDSSNSLSSL